MRQNNNDLKLNNFIMLESKKNLFIFPNCIYVDDFSGNSEQNGARS